MTGATREEVQVNTEKRLNDLGAQGYRVVHTHYSGEWGSVWTLERSGLGEQLATPYRGAPEQP